MRLPTRADFPSSRRELIDDLIAGATVAIVALPLAIGFGITSGMSAAAGISTAIIAGFIAALFGGSDRKSTRLNSSHIPLSRMPSSA